MANFCLLHTFLARIVARHKYLRNLYLDQVSVNACVTILLTNYVENQYSNIVALNGYYYLLQA